VKADGLTRPIVPPMPMPDFTEVFDPLVMMQARPAEKEEPRRRGIDVGAVITRALTAAGLIK
jgi:hypothetical protein